MNVRQSVLLEVWDKDTFSPSDFLGECFLPPLSSIGPNVKTLVLPIRGAPDEQEGNTRPEAKKRLDKKIKCTGELFVEASWKFPLQDETPESDGVSLEARAKQ